MKMSGGDLQLSASDLVGHLNCQHLTELDLQVVSGALAKPYGHDPLLEILQERGMRHEAAYIQHLRNQGQTVTQIEGVGITADAVEQTRTAMVAGNEIIVQAALQHGCWVGRIDILHKVEVPGSLGSWSYEVVDTKLARETKAGTVLQLCLYADLLAHYQGQPPEFVHVVAPWSDYIPQTFRVADFAAYFRRVKDAAEQATSQAQQQTHYPDPKPHCDVCRWAGHCAKRRRADDHLSLVANISTTQINELKARGITTATQLAQMPLPLDWKPERGSSASYEKVREQARIQIESRPFDKPKYELLPIDETVGLCLLPEPSDGDIFFDIEGDPFVGEHGLEYLFGYQYRDENGEAVYVGDWALNRASEKAIFERFMDFVVERQKQYPDLHIYHYAPYEPAALKRLMGRYATREEEVDGFLRGKVLVDLYSVVRNAIRAGVESYSIKKLEPIYGFERQADLKDANVALVSLQAGLELGTVEEVTAEDRDTVELYNLDDCASTMALQDWLEGLRSKLVAQGQDVPRPARGEEQPSEEFNEQRQRVLELVTRLTADIPIAPEERSDAQQAQWVLAHLLDWHRREAKAAWWEFFRLGELTPEDLLDEKAALAGLAYKDTVDSSRTGIPTDRYSFPQQDCDFRGGEDLHSPGGHALGKLVSICSETRTVEVKKTGKTKDSHPSAVYAHTMYRSDQQEASLFRVGQWVAEHGIEAEGDYVAARSLLQRLPPALKDGALLGSNEKPLEMALRVASNLEPGVFAVQGPPGTGKSYTGARMICQLVADGKRVGITANSHKVIRNLLDKVIEASEEMNVELCCVQKPKEREDDTDHLKFVTNNGSLLSVLSGGECQVAGATHFFWSREDAQGAVDVLVVDEAAQMSLANVVAVAASAERVILLGDPQQLDQPTQGTHPDGVGVSSLEHVLGSDQTIAEDRGMFLPDTWRLHPEITKLTSELFYEGKLDSIELCKLQEVKSKGQIKGSGLRYLPVAHSGNQSSSIEEVDAVKVLVNSILKSEPTWVTRDDVEMKLTLNDILIIAPYNAQVFEIQQRLPEARVGTVDKFQGQEAPIAIYSMTTSSHADAPRGMEFLYSANRFNVATSRAKCIAILVASPGIFEADCRTPQQMQLANAFCRYLELAEQISL